MSMMNQFASALAAIHKMNVVHRDLKPENLLVDIEFTTIKVCDFGIAAECKIIDAKGNRKRIFSTAVGTQLWQSPELRDVQPNGGATSVSDIHGCGLIIQFTARRRLPFERVEDWANNVDPPEPLNYGFAYILHPLMC